MIYKKVVQNLIDYFVKSIFQGHIDCETTEEYKMKLRRFVPNSFFRVLLRFKDANLFKIRG